MNSILLIVGITIMAVTLRLSLNRGAMFFYVMLGCLAAWLALGAAGVALGISFQIWARMGIGFIFGGMLIFDALAMLGVRWAGK